MNILLKPSKWQPRVFITLHVVVISLIFLLDLQSDWKAVAIVLLCIGSYIFKSKRVVRLQKDTSSNWEVEYLSGNILFGKLTGNSISNRYFSLLTLKSMPRILQKSILVFHDTLNTKDYHNLRLHLKGLLD